MRLASYIFKKIIRCFTLLIGVSVLSFALLKASPVDPVLASVDYDPMLTIEQYNAIARHYGLDKPASAQYFIWLKNFVQGDMGTSLVHARPVSEIIRSKAGASAALMGISWIISGFLGFVLGALGAFKRGEVIDRIIKWLAYLQTSVPTFWIGLLFLLIFSVKLGWFPIGISSPIGKLSQDVILSDKVRHLVLPVFTLSILGTASVALHTREKMIDVLNSEYVLFAQARGQNSWQVFKNHGLRNAIVPALTLHFAHFGELFGGAVLAEEVFSYPGLGTALTEAGLKGDTPLLLGIVIIGAIFVFVGNMLADIANALINPQLRSS